jgi:hypothetical protein
MKYMKHKILAQLVICINLFMISAGCSNVVKEPTGSWKLINSLGSTIEVKELERPYYYGALPIDTSLNSMVSRWASDTNITAEHHCRFDYSIPVKLLKSQMTSIKAAMHEIMHVYSIYGVQVEFNANKTTMIISCGVNNKEEFLKPPSVISDSNHRANGIDP